MAMLNRLVWLFTAPTKVFDDIREGRAPWWQPWIWQSILYGVAGYLSLPVQRRVAELNPRGLSPEQLDKQLAAMAKFAWLQIIATPPMVLLFGLALAGLTYILVTILSSQANFKRYFTITLYSSIIGGLSMIVSTLVVRWRGVESIRTAQDAQVTFGLGFLAPEGHGVLAAMLSTVNVFSVWGFFILGLGLMRVFGMSRNQAIACVIPWWLISLAMAAAGSAFSGLG